MQYVAVLFTQTNRGSYGHTGTTRNFRCAYCATQVTGAQQQTPYVLWDGLTCAKCGSTNPLGIPSLSTRTIL